MRKSYEDCDCCEGQIFDGTHQWNECIDCDYNMTEAELAEEAYWDKYDLDEAEIKGN